jgi:redox-sensitive bicupin YhaK (pirin superfamily)
VTDIGGVPVRRLVPQRGLRLVGPWCFLDLFGPLTFDTDKPMDVAPHPHLGLQTVTWILEGEALHKDSLDSEALARPGALNLMTSGGGIAHSEETPPQHSRRLHGVQLWIALPDADRHGPPHFDHYAERPRVERDGWRAVVMMGALDGVDAAARTFSPVFGAEVAIDAGRRAAVPVRADFEHGVVPLAGEATVDGQPLANEQIHYFAPNVDEIVVTAGREPSRLLVIGGAPFGETVLMWWNFVARTTAEIVAAREDWEAGRRFGDVRRYRGPRIPAPAFTGRPVPANPMS